MKKRDKLKDRDVVEKELELLINPLNIRVAILGRPNVGKSTLVNRLLAEKEGMKALIDKSPGMTRDRKDMKGQFNSLRFTIIDTPGLEIPHERAKDRIVDTQMLNGETISLGIQQAMLEQAECALQEADVLVFLYDAREGVSVMDRHWADWIRKRIISREVIAPGWWARGEPPPRLEPEVYRSMNWTRQEKKKGLDALPMPPEFWDPEDTKEVSVQVPVLCVANKTESEKDSVLAGVMEGGSLGFGEPVSISANHDQGMGDFHYHLIRAMMRAFPPKFQEYRSLQELKTLGHDPSSPSFSSSSSSEEDTYDEDDTFSDDEFDSTDSKSEGERGPRRLSLVIAGKPNVGKSTIINSLIGEERLIVGPQAGVTRDSCTVKFSDPRYEEEFDIVDTAGLRGTSKRDHQRFSNPDLQSMRESVRSIKYASVVALVIDASDGVVDALKIPKLSQNPSKNELIMVKEKVSKVFSKHDIAVARKAEEEGRALIVVANKWDRVKAKDKKVVLRGLLGLMETMLPQASGVQVITCCGTEKAGKGVTQILPAVMEAYEKWNERIPTTKLNEWLQGVQQFTPHPDAQGSPVRLKFMTQTKTRPPSFSLWRNRHTVISKNYLRFLMNKLREEFELEGVPVRLLIRQGKNPYATDKDKRQTSSKTRASY